MKVKCIKTKIDNEQLMHDDAEGFLDVGEEYFVSSIFIVNNYIYYDIGDSFKFLSWPNEMFEIVNNNIPTIWRVKVFLDGNLLIGPELFFEEYFFDRFSDGYDHEVIGYENIKHLLDI